MERQMGLQDPDSRHGRSASEEGNGESLAPRRAESAPTRGIFDHLLEGVLEVDRAGRILLANPAVVRMLDFACEAELLGTEVARLYEGEGALEVPWSRGGDASPPVLERRMKRRNGELIDVLERVTAVRDAAGRRQWRRISLLDVTLHKRYERQLLERLTTDELSGLSNRRVATQQLERALDREKRHGAMVALAFLDLDGFKDVNRTLGQAVGDELLVIAGQRLSTCVRLSDTLARSGGDEFLAVLPGVKTRGGASRVARSMLEKIRAPLDLAEQELVVTASIGVSIAPDDGSRASILLSNAEAAMCRAKRRGGGQVCFYDPRFDDGGADRIRIESCLRRGIVRGELSVAYQPIFSVAERTLAGAEALLRWNSAELGPVAAEQLVAVAEDSGLIVPIGEWVLEQACAEAAHWYHLVDRPPRVAVNLSPVQMRHGDLVRVVQRALEGSGLPPSLLELEITERLLVDDDPAVRATLSKLRSWGVRISLDDFGTGRSSLDYLRRFSLDTLKIDRVFLRQARHDAKVRSLVAAIVAMGHCLGLEVVAEGVEVASDLRFLGSQSCDLAQGFLLGRPMSSAELRSLPIPQRGGPKRRGAAALANEETA